MLEDLFEAFITIGGFLLGLATCGAIVVLIASFSYVLFGPIGALVGGFLGFFFVLVGLYYLDLRSCR